MVRFRQKVDRNNRIYLVRALREMGLDETIEILPSSKAAVIFSSKTSPLEVLQSIRVIALELECQQNPRDCSQDHSFSRGMAIEKQ